MFSLLDFSLLSILIDVGILSAFMVIAWFEWFPVYLIGIAGTAFALQFFNIFPVIDKFKENPGAILLYVAIYLLVGIVYAFIKWFFFVGKSKDDVAQAYNAYRNSNLSEEENMKWFKESYQNPINWRNNDNKWRITNWFTTWPFHILSTTIHSLTIDLYKNILSMMSGLLDKISERGYGNITK